MLLYLSEAAKQGTSNHYEDRRCRAYFWFTPGGARPERLLFAVVMTSVSSICLAGYIRETSIFRGACGWS